MTTGSSSGLNLEEKERNENGTTGTLVDPQTEELANEYMGIK